MWTEWFLGFLGLTSGMAVAGGMFALLIALGVVARFAGKTHTARAVMQYEDAAALGGILGNLFSIYQFHLPVGVPGAAIFGFLVRYFYRSLGHGPNGDCGCGFLFSAGESA